MKRSYVFSFFVLILLFVNYNSYAKNGKDPIKILAIGNSFSVDGVEYLDELAEAADVDIIVGNLHIGGCSLERHWKNAENNIPDYEYFKYKAGKMSKQDNATLSDALTNESWDYVTFQQRSPDSGIYDTYFPYLSNLIEYVKEKVDNPKLKLAMQQTWAYAQNSTHGDFKNYDKDQMKMYTAIVDAYNRAAKTVGIKIIIPTGTAVQNMRSEIGDIMCRDGYHLSLGLGRYTAACAWYSTFVGNVVGNSFKPENVSGEEAHMAQLAARAAKRHPNKISYNFIK